MRYTSNLPFGIFASLGLLLWLASAQAQDVQVNKPDHNVPNQDNNTTESETNHAVFGSTVVVGYNSSVQFASLGTNFNSFTGFAFSTNGGTSFTDAGFLAPPTGFVLMGDPAVAVDRLGNFYFASLGVTDSQTLAGSRVLVARSTSINPSVTFGTPAVIPGVLNNGSSFQDKELIAVDTSGGPFDGRVYVAWSEFASIFSSSAQVLVTSSTSTSPLTFAATTALSPADVLHHGAMPAVGPNGEVYVAWTRFPAGNAEIHVVKSTNGGANFVNPDAADPNPTKTAVTFPATAGEMTSGGINIRTRSFPYIAIDNSSAAHPTRGYVYIVFQANPGQGADRSDIFFIRSTDGGVTWSAPRCINKAPAAQINPDSTLNDNWQPSISVSPATGQITVTFYDRRDDAANTKIALYRAVSTDGGMTWFNSQASSVSFTPSTGYDPPIQPDYMGDYNGSFADANNVYMSWGDTRNKCAPPGGATSPCSPAGRGDQDVFYVTSPVLHGPDLYITPWGDITGIGPLWQTPDIFVVDNANNVVNAEKGIINNLRARVRNLGDAPAAGATIRLKYAPIFLGLTPAAMKQIAAPTADFAAVGDPMNNDLKVIPVSWDLSNLADTNGGLWPMPISAFDHFCVQVNVEHPSDINLTNNFAQNNFVDVQTMMFSRLPLRFLIGNPFRRPVEAEIVVAGLPEGFRADWGESKVPVGKSFRLKPEEILVASVTFVPPPGFTDHPVQKDVVANVTLKIDGKAVGGLSARLASTEKGGAGQLFEADYEVLFKYIVEMLRERKMPVSLADPKKGLINTGSIPAEGEVLMQMTSSPFRAQMGRSSGRYLLTFRLQRLAARKTLVTVKPLIIVSAPVDNPLGGLPVPSSGYLEKQMFQALEAFIAARR